MYSTNFSLFEHVALAARQFLRGLH